MFQSWSGLTLEEYSTKPDGTAGWGKAGPLRAGLSLQVGKAALPARQAGGGRVAGPPVIRRVLCRCYFAVRSLCSLLLPQILSNGQGARGPVLLYLFPAGLSRQKSPGRGLSPSGSDDFTNI